MQRVKVQRLRFAASDQDSQFVRLHLHIRYAAIENVIPSTKESKKVKDRVFDCHLSPDWRQMAIENTVFVDF